MKIAALFPGYGSQFVGMGKELYDESRIVQEHFEQAANCLDANFVKLCFASSDLEIAKMNNAFPALFLVSSSIFDLLTSEGIEVDLVAGYNIGQYAALHAAGSLSLPDGLYLINKFVALYQELVDKGDIAFLRTTGVSTKQVQALCEKISTDESLVVVAVHSSDTTQVIAGHAEAVHKIGKVILDLEGTTEMVGPEDGLHSQLMEPVAKTFKMYLEKVDFKDASTPLICNVDARYMRLGKDLQECAVSWITQPVLWSSVVDGLESCDLLIEIGPGTQLRDMLIQRYPDKKIMSINKRSDIEQLKRILGMSPTTPEK